MSENTRMTAAAGVVGAATLLSRIMGYVRDMVVARFFGAGLAADAFFMAFVVSSKKPYQEIKSILRLTPVPEV